MNKKLKIDGVFAEALPVLNQIVEAGFEAYFVGGSVRDRLLNLEVNDVDIATSAQPHEIKEIFTRTVDVGIEHGTVMVLVEGVSYEITTFRTESTYKDFRRPDLVTFVRSLEEDLKRRDFTMNAIAMDAEGYIIDPFSGIKDLNAGIIRAVGNPHERFREDALRMMRAVRFSAQLDFEIEAETQVSIKENAPLLEKIAVERIQVEFEKLLTGTWHANGLAAMIQTRLYLYCPELANKKAALVSLIQDENKFEHVRQAWAFLLYKIDEYDPTDSFNARKFLKAWKLSNKLMDQAVMIFNALKQRVTNKSLDEWEVFCLGKEFALETESLVQHLEEPPAFDKVVNIYEHLPIKEKDALALTGYDLMNATATKPGRWMSEAMEAALQAVVYAEIQNDKEEILTWLIEKNLIPGLNDE